MGRFYNLMMEIHREKNTDDTLWYPIDEQQLEAFDYYIKFMDKIPHIEMEEEAIKVLAALSTYSGSFSIHEREYVKYGDGDGEKKINFSKIRKAHIRVTEDFLKIIDTKSPDIIGQYEYLKKRRGNLSEHGTLHALVEKFLIQLKEESPEAPHFLMVKANDYKNFHKKPLKKPIIDLFKDIAKKYNIGDTTNQINNFSKHMNDTVHGYFSSLDKIWTS